MANASKKHIGIGSHGKGAGVGAMTDIDKEKIGENMVLSNHDKARHSEERGQDGKQIQTEQYQDHSVNRILKREDKEAE